MCIRNPSTTPRAPISIRTSIIILRVKYKRTPAPLSIRSRLPRILFDELLCDGVKISMAQPVRFPPPRSFCISPLKRSSQARCAFALLPHLCIISPYCAFALLPHRSSQAFALHPHLCVFPPLNLLCIRPASSFCILRSSQAYCVFALLPHVVVDRSSQQYCASALLPHLVVH
jgi:hypothetical protein